MGMSHQPITAKLLWESAAQLAIDALNAKRALRDGHVPITLPEFDVSHDHRAVHDAEVIGRRWAFFQQILS
jgi:hypothetical protein